MRHIILSIALMLGVAAAASQANAQSPPPAKVCKSLMGKIIPCPMAKPVAVKPAAPPAATAAKPGMLSHLTSLGRPAAAASPAPTPAVKPAAAPPSAPAPMQKAAVAPNAASPAAGGSQASPVGATAKCNDGTYWRSKTHAGSCSRHNGVAVFY